MNRKLMILAVTGAIVLAGCARMMADKPKEDGMRTSVQMMEAPQEAAAKPAPSKAQPAKPKPKPVPKTTQQRH